MSKFRTLYAEAIELANGQNKQAAIYQIGNLLFLIPLTDIIDIPDTVEIRPVPGSVDYFKGVFLYNGKPILLIDTPRILSLPEIESNTVMIVKALGNEEYAFVISNIAQVLPYSDSWEQAPPGEHEKILPEFIEKVIKINQNTLYQLKINKLFNKNHA